MSERRGDRGTGVEEHPDELLAAYALGALEGEELEAVEEHVAGCAACREELAHLQQAVDALPFAADPLTPPPMAKARLMSRVRKSRLAQEPPRRRFWQLPSNLRFAWGSAAVGLAAALVFAVVAGASSQHAAALQRENAVLARANREQLLVLASLDPNRARTLALQGSASVPQATGRFLYDPGKTDAVVILVQLPPLAPDKTYQFWLISGSTPVSGGTFDVDQDGIGRLVVNAPQDLSSYGAVGITVEQKPGRSAPSMQPLIGATL